MTFVVGFINKYFLQYISRNMIVTVAGGFESQDLVIK